MNLPPHKHIEHIGASNNAYVCFVLCVQAIPIAIGSYVICVSMW
jgi:hypothetical protein